MNTEPNENPTNRTARRNGNVARLPKKLRDLINSMLDDGNTYPEIIAALEKSTEPTLPWSISPKNLSNWFDGGYQDYLRNQTWAGAVRDTQEKVLSAAAEDPVKFADAGVQLAATGICELLAELSRLQASDEKASDRYARIANSMARLAKTILTYEQHRQTVAKEKAAELKKLDPKRELNDSENLAIVDHVNRLFGLRQYRKLRTERVGAPAIALPARTTVSNVTASFDEAPSPAQISNLQSQIPSTTANRAPEPATPPDPSPPEPQSQPTITDTERAERRPWDWYHLSEEAIEKWRKENNIL